MSPAAIARRRRAARARNRARIRPPSVSPAETREEKDSREALERLRHP